MKILLLIAAIVILTTGGCASTYDNAAIGQTRAECEMAGGPRCNELPEFGFGDW